MKKITTTIPDLFDERLRAIATSEGRTIASIVSMALEEYLRNYKPLPLI